MKLMHVSGPELPGGAPQMATLLSVGTSSLHTAVSLAVKPVQLTLLLAVFFTSSSVLSVPHGDSVTAGTVIKGVRAYGPVKLSVFVFVSSSSSIHSNSTSTRTILVSASYELLKAANCGVGYIADKN